LSSPQPPASVPGIGASPRPPAPIRRSRRLLYVQSAFGILGVIVGLLLLGAGDQAIAVAAIVLGLLLGAISLVLASRIKTGRRRTRTAIIVFEAAIAVLQIVSIVDSLLAQSLAGVGGQVVGLAIALMVLVSMTSDDARAWFQVT
jgi:hypothetical protein